MTVTGVRDNVLGSFAPEIRLTRAGMSHEGARRRERVNLEEVLAKIVELGQEELHILRKRAEEQTPARDHGQDFHDMQQAADRLDHHAHVLRRLHDKEWASGWRHESLGDVRGG